MSSSPTVLSVLLCTHNPDPKLFGPTIEALQEQTLPRSQWELIIVDNASRPPISDTCSLAWHPHGRIVREEELGLTAARLCAFREAQSDLFVMVDDDAVLAPDYLEVASKTAEAYPQIGAFGGNVALAFPEGAPPAYLTKVGWMLAERHFTKATHGKEITAENPTPCGVGMVLRRNLAKRFVTAVTTDPRRRSLGRKGQNLASSEDTDIIMLAVAMGFEFGHFPNLSLTHLIPARRTTRAYVERLMEAFHASDTGLAWIHGKQHEQTTWLKQIRSYTRAYRHDGWWGLKLHAAAQRGRARARAMIADT